MMALVMSAMHCRAVISQSPVSPCCYPLSNDPLHFHVCILFFSGPCRPFPEDFCFYKSDISGVVVANISCRFPFTSFLQSNLVNSASILPSVPCSPCPIARHFLCNSLPPPLQAGGLSWLFCSPSSSPGTITLLEPSVQCECLGGQVSEWSPCHCLESSQKGLVWD